MAVFNKASHREILRSDIKGGGLGVNLKIGNKIIRKS